MGTEYPRLVVTDSPLTLTDALDEDLKVINEEKRPFASKSVLLGANGYPSATQVSTVHWVSDGSALPKKSHLPKKSGGCPKSQGWGFGAGFVDEGAAVVSVIVCDCIPADSFSR